MNNMNEDNTTQDAAYNGYELGLGDLGGHGKGGGDWLTLRQLGERMGGFGGAYTQPSLAPNLFLLLLI